MSKDIATIGVAGVTIPGAIDCIDKINRFSPDYFPPHVHPHILMYQPSFHSMRQALVAEDWDAVLKELIRSIEILAKSGADFAIIPANSVHKVIGEVQKRSPIPVLNMLEAVADECLKQNLKTIGVLGTVWTMSGHLYQEVLEAKGRIERIPSEEEQKMIQRAILAELVPTGKATASTLSSLLAVAASLQHQGCDGIALACTELPLALNRSNCPLPVIDTTAVLAKAALARAKLFDRFS